MGMHKDQENKGKLKNDENFPTVMLILLHIPPEDDSPSPHKAISACNLPGQCQASHRYDHWRGLDDTWTGFRNSHCARSLVSFSFLDRMVKSRLSLSMGLL